MGARKGQRREGTLIMLLFSVCFITDGTTDPDAVSIPHQSVLSTANGTSLNVSSNLNQPFKRDITAGFIRNVQEYIVVLSHSQMFIC